MIFFHFQFLNILSIRMGSMHLLLETDGTFWQANESAIKRVDSLVFIDMVERDSIE